MEKKASTIVGIVVLSITFIVVMAYGMMLEKTRISEDNTNYTSTTTKRNTTKNNTTSTNTTNTTRNTITNTETNTTNTTNTERPDNDIIIKNIIDNTNREI